MAGVNIGPGGKMEWYGDDVIKSVKHELPKAIREACKIVEDAAQNLSPVDTGALKGSITHEPIDDHSAKVGPSIEYDIHVEMGTYKMAAQPYLRPAADNNRARVARELGVTIGQLVIAGGKK